MRERPELPWPTVLYSTEGAHLWRPGQVIPVTREELEADGRLMHPDAIKALAIRAATAAVGTSGA